jgi:hypothetical protein
MARTKVVMVITNPRMLEKYSGLSVKDVRPLKAKFKYLVNEKVDVPA